MNFVKEKIRDFYLRDSQIENIFINEYLPAAPGDYVKVFIYGAMYAEFGLDMTNELMAKQLGISVRKVMDAWNYWEQMGAIRKLYFDENGRVDFSVEFINLKEQMYGKSDTPVQSGANAGDQGEVTVFGNEEVKKLFTDVEQTVGRSLSSTEIRRILSWVADDKIQPELVLFCAEYCKERGKTSIRYINSVLRSWSERGVITAADAQQMIAETDQRYYQYRRVLQALGFTRNATEAEKQMMDRWFDEYGYSMDRVLEACGRTAGISSPNFNYVNKVLENWKDEAHRRGSGDVNKQTVTQAQLRKYYDYLRERAGREADRRLQEVYRKIPRIKEIDRLSTELGASLSRAFLKGTDGGRGPEIREQTEELEEERAVQLTDNNYEMDYTDIHYYCEKCHDTGITDSGERCTCVPERMEEAEIWIHQSEAKDYGEKE